MGNASGKQSCLWDGQFDAEQLKRMQRRFERIAGKSGRADYESIANEAGIELNPLVVSLFNSYSKQHGSMSYPELLNLLTSLCQLNDPAERAQVVFKAFDLNNDGSIDTADLLGGLQHISGQGMQGPQVARIAACTVALFDVDNDDKLSQQEFAALLHDQGGLGLC